MGPAVLYKVPCKSGNLGAVSSGSNSPGSLFYVGSVALQLCTILYAKNGVLLFEMPIGSQGRADQVIQSDAMVIKAMEIHGLGQT